MRCPQSFISIRDGEDTILEIPLSYQLLGIAVREIEDTDDNAALFEVLASHPSVLVRREVASMGRINKATFQLLAEDPSVQVVSQLVACSALTYATQEGVMAFIDRDTDIAQTVASMLAQFENIDVPTVVDKLLSTGDPEVAATLANSTVVPREILQRLLEHPDPKVRSAAKESLNDGDE